MKAMIIYCSRYGATAQYAEWLSEKLGMPVYPVDAVNMQELAAADVVILGSPVYIGKMLMRQWLHKNKAMLAGKRIFFFVVCAGAATDEKAHAPIIEHNLPDHLCDKKDVYFLPGRLDLKKLSWSDKMLLKIGSMLEKDPAKKNVMRNGIDAVSKAQLQDIIAAVSLYLSARYQSEGTVSV